MVCLDFDSKKLISSKQRLDSTYIESLSAKPVESKKNSNIDDKFLSNIVENLNYSSYDDRIAEDLKDVSKEYKHINISTKRPATSLAYKGK